MCYRAWGLVVEPGPATGPQQPRLLVQAQHGDHLVNIIRTPAPDPGVEGDHVTSHQPSVQDDLLFPLSLQLLMVQPRRS